MLDNYEQLSKALKYAQLAHKGQVDKAGVDYIFHPILVALQCKCNAEKIAALLHDAIEDGEGRVTVQDLEKDFDPEIIEAIKQLTHDKNVDYFDYLNNINSPIALKVKLADLTMNMDLNRISNIKEEDLLRLEKYKRAKEIVINKLKELE